MRNEDCGYQDERDERYQDDPENWPVPQQLIERAGEDETEERASSVGNPFGAR